MLSETLSSGLKRYKIGEKIRQLRLKKSMGLVQLGQHTSLSPAMLSKIERGQLFPTLPTLLRIALVFGVGLDHFFLEDGRRPLSVTRKKERIQLPDTAGSNSPAYFFESLDYPVPDRRVESFYAEFPIGSKQTAVHNHEGEERIYIIEGDLAINVDGDEVILHEGDLMHVESRAPHSYRREGGVHCRALVMVGRL